MMRQIIEVHFPDIDGDLMDSRRRRLLPPARDRGHRKEAGHPGADQLDPGPAADPDFKPKQLAKGDVPFLGVLFKKSHGSRPRQPIAQARADAMSRHASEPIESFDVHRFFLSPSETTAIPVQPTAFLDVAQGPAGTDRVP